ncbi:MAG: amino acid ABC transporter permease, partial [Pseudomonadota bacterium]
MTQTKDADFPWWLVILGVTGLWMGYEVWASAIYAQVIATLVKGIQVTVAVTLVAYVSASALGLALAVAGLSRYVVLRQAARIWIEVIRGV